MRVLIASAVELKVSSVDKSDHASCLAVVYDTVSLLASTEDKDCGVLSYNHKGLGSWLKLGYEEKFPCDWLCVTVLIQLFEQRKAFDRVEEPWTLSTEDEYCLVRRNT